MTTDNPSMPTLLANPSSLDADGQAALAVANRMADEGLAPTMSAEVDYFGGDQIQRWMLPGSKEQFFDIKVMAHGSRTKYQESVTRDVKIERRSGDAHMRLGSAAERDLLIREAVTDLYLKKGQKFVSGKKEINTVLVDFPTEIIDLLYKEIVKINPWVLGELSLEDMIAERDSLNEMIEVKQKEEAGKADS